jgi:uncharacterized membrane protein
MNKRYFELDVLRGSAVVLMLLFHFGYDLAYFGYASFKTTQDVEWILFRGLILSMFLISVGMSLYLVYRDEIRGEKLFKRTMKLFAVSVVISAGSYLVFPTQWIYFGVIHFIAVASVAGVLFVARPNLALLLGSAIIISYVAGLFRLDGLLEFLSLYLPLPRHTVDVVSFTPWFGVVLIGIFVMHNRLFGLRSSENHLTQSVSFLGRHALAVYLLQQPVLFSLFYTIQFLR